MKRPGPGRQAGGPGESRTWAGWAAPETRRNPWVVREVRVGRVFSTLKTFPRGNFFVCAHTQRVFTSEFCSAENFIYFTRTTQTTQTDVENTLMFSGPGSSREQVGTQPTRTTRVPPRPQKNPSAHLSRQRRPATRPAL